MEFGATLQFWKIKLTLNPTWLTNCIYCVIGWEQRNLLLIFNYSVPHKLTPMKLSQSHTWNIYVSNNKFCCVVSLSIFTSCAVFWRAHRASQNTARSKGMFVQANFADIYLQGMSDRSMHGKTSTGIFTGNCTGKPANWLVNGKQTCVTGPLQLEYKYRVIFVLAVLSVICTLRSAVGE